MRTNQVVSAVIVVAFLILLAGWAFAGDGKAQGQPFQYLQQQIDELRGQIPTQPDVQGCWSGSFIVTSTGGSAPTPNGMPTTGTPPNIPGISPFYWNTGTKRLNQLYMMVTFQAGTQIKGTYYSWIGSICQDQNGNEILYPYCTWGRFYGFPFEGWVNGNAFQLRTSTTNSPFNGREEQRYLNGIFTEDSEGKKVIHGMGMTSRDMAPQGTNPASHSWSNLVWTFTLEPYEGSCDTLPAPRGSDVSFGLVPQYWGWVMPPTSP